MLVLHSLNHRGIVITFLSGLSRELNQTRLKSRSPETFAFRVGGLEFSEMGGCPKWRGVLNPSKNYAKACNFIKEETLVQVFSCEFCEIFKSSFFDRTPGRLLLEKLSQNCCEGLCNVPENAMAFLRCLKNTFTQIAITCSKPTMETAKKCVKSVQTIVTTPEPRNSEAFTISFVMLQNGLKEKNAQNCFEKLKNLHTLLNHHYLFPCQLISYSAKKTVLRPRLTELYRLKRR